MTNWELSQKYKHPQHNEINQCNTPHVLDWTASSQRWMFKLPQPSVPVNTTLFGSRDVIKLRWVHTGLGWAWIPLLIPVSLEEEEILDTETHGHMQRKMPCEDGDEQECCQISFTSDTMNKLELEEKQKRWKQRLGLCIYKASAKDCWQATPEARRRHRFSLAPKENKLADTPQFWTFSWQNARTRLSVVLGHLAYGDFIKPALGSQYDTWLHWKENHMIILTHTDKVFDKLQYLFIII